MEDYDHILTRYTRMRKASRAINDAFMERCKPPVKQAAADLGVLVNDTIVLDVDQGPVLMDRAIYHLADDGRNIVDRFAAEYPPSPGSDAETVLSAMQQAFFSLFVVGDVQEGVGVHVTDILRDREHFVADVGFSETAIEGFVLAARMLPFRDFVMTTGAALPVSKKVLKWVARGLDKAGLSHEQVRNLPDHAWADLEAQIVRACLHSDGNQRITYQDAPGVTGPTPIQNASDRVGRNDPCPCGSGRKYKKCCGAAP